jgi:hypothetical protein
VRARDLAREQTVKEDIIRQPIELIDEDLDVIAGTQGLDIDIGVDLNVAVVNQLIEQIQAFSSNVTASAANGVAISQTS